MHANFTRKRHLFRASDLNLELISVYRCFVSTFWVLGLHMGRHTWSAFPWLWKQFLILVWQVHSLLHISPVLYQGIRLAKSLLKLEHPQDFTFSQPHLYEALNGASPHLGLTDGAVQLSPYTGPPTSPARPTVSLFTWQAVLGCVSPSLCPFNSVSALVLWEAGAPSEHRKDGSPQLLCCPVSVLSPHLCTPPPPQFIFSAQPGSQISGCWNVLWRNKHLSHFFSRRWII